MIAYTDGGFNPKRNYSRHAYIIMDDNNKVIKKRKFKGFESNSINSEIRSIEKLLQDMIHEDVNGMVIYSDCKYLVDTINKGHNNLIKCDYLKYLLKSSGASLKWINRSKNKLADKMVHRVGRPKVRKGLLIK